MEQKDYILREIEKIAVLMRYLLGKMIPTTQEEEVMTTEAIDAILTDEMGVSLEDLASIPPDQFPSYFNDNKGFSLENLESLGDLLYQLSLRKEKNHLIYGQQSLNIYMYIDAYGHVYSLSRATRIQTLLKLLDQQK